jgi:MFS-type transporter involved in bile tolerance (Atg22 family)
MGIAYAAGNWTDFGVAAASAAAALAGLLVVAVSINLERILQYPGLPHRAGQTLILFTLPLITALLLIVPGQPSAALGCELLVIGLPTGAFMVVSDARVPISEHETKATRLFARTVPPIVSCGCLAVSGATLLGEAGGGLYWLVPAVLAAFVSGLVNAWVLLIEILR